VIEIDIPDYKTLHLEHLVLDYNGTLAVDGALIDGVAEMLESLSTQLEIHVVTADTFGRVEAAMAGLPCRVSILPPGQQDTGKLTYVGQLGLDRAVCIGNGRNDRLMLQQSALGIVLLQAEGAAAQTLMSADVVAASILDALELLTNPLRLIATLRA
jgi:soluble P-type ATPase